MIFCLTIDLVFDGHGPFFFSHGLPFDLWCLKLEVYNWTTGPANIAVYSQLSPYGHLAITDTPLLRTLCKSPAKPIINYIAVALAITDSRYYGIADTSCGPQHNIFIVLLSLQRTPWTYFSLNTT